MAGLSRNLTLTLADYAASMSSGITRRGLLRASAGSLAALLAARTGAERQDTGRPRVMQGPMVGASESDAVTIWARTSEAVELAIAYGTTADFAQTRISPPVPTHAGEDYTAAIRIGGLQPDSPVHYRLLVNGEPDGYLADFGGFATRTAPAAGRLADFAVAFGSCARFSRDPVQPIWRAVAARRPGLFFWLGDNVYADSRNPAAIAEEYRRQRDVATYQLVGRSIPQLAIWDDHDYGLNDHDRTNPVKEESLAIFRRYWANPAYGTPDTPGVFFRYSYGGVDFFLLDCRYHRSPNTDDDGPRKTHLGAGQLDWLRTGLAESEAPFKVLVSGGGWTRAKGPGGDSWAAFLHERDALFDFIRDQEIGGVVLLSGDTHVAELNAVPWSARGGYDYYDLTSSPLAQPPTDSWLRRRPELRIRPVYFRSPNFGLLSFRAQPEPALSYTVIDTRGRHVWRPLELRAAELANGVRSWPQKIDASLHEPPWSYPRPS